MAWLHDGEKNSQISLFVLAQLTNVTDRQTDGHRIASRDKNAVYRHVNGKIAQLKQQISELAF